MRNFILLIVFLMSMFSIQGQTSPKNRVIVLTDIEADPDDTESLVRLLLYSNEIDIRGIIATTSCWHKTMVNPESVKRIVTAYGKVQPNLLKHKPDFPEAAALFALIRQGIPEYGMLGVGKDKDSEGSEWIIRELERPDERPLWISIWGGSNTLAQALYKLKRSLPEKEFKRRIAKLRVLCHFGPG